MSEASAAADPMHEADTVAAFRPSLGDRLFEWAGIAPGWMGAAIAALLLALLTLGASLSGRMEDLREAGGLVALFTQRDPRGLILFVLLFTYAATARRYVLLGGVRGFDELAPLLARQPGLDVAALRVELAERPTHAGRRRRRGLVSLAIAPVVAVAIDRDPGLYLLAEYWNFERTAQWVAGLALCWNLGLLIDATLVVGRRFDALARRLGRIDLLSLDELAPFARLGLRAALVWLVMAGIFALNVVDAGYLGSVIGLSLLSLGVATASVLPPMLGARARVRECKREELARVSGALRGDVTALGGSVLEQRAANVSVTDLLAWREHVAALPEWPFDTPMLLRLLLYVAIPVGSWVGGAFVERLLESTLG